MVNLHKVLKIMLKYKYLTDLYSNLGSASVDNVSSGWHCHPVKNVIFILLYRMSHLYTKFHRRETLPCDIQNCHPANWQIRLLEINMRYNNRDCHPSKSIVNLGSASVDNVSSGWQSTMSPRKECDIYIMYPFTQFKNPKREDGPYCKLNPILKCSISLNRVSFCISTTWLVSLLVDHRFPRLRVVKY